MRFKLLAFFLLPVCLSAQDRKPVPAPPKSPNVAAMDRFGNFEVDLFRGLPDISIPLYEIKTRHHTVPVTLSYHASGIKVTDVASWAGLGWSVNTGGYIGRKVKGEDDGLGYLKPDFNLLKPDELHPESLDGYYYLKSILDGSMDNQPDVFSYKVPGKYGHFFHTGYNKPVVTVPYDPVQISRIMDPVATAEIAHFQMTDEAGKRYTFGNSKGEIIAENSVTQRGGSSSGYRSTWLLTTMNSADNTDSVVFRYQPHESMTLFWEMDDYYTATGNISNRYGTCGVTQSVTQGGLWVSYTASQRLLKEIEYDNGKVEFILSTANRSDLSTRSLEKINVYGKEKGLFKLLKSVQFHQSYFTGTGSRLRLDSISIVSPAATEKMVYRFSYNNSTDVVPLESRSKDYWGYYNGSGTNTLVPGTYTWFPYGSRRLIGGQPDARKPNPDAVQMAILRRIQYPTGGHTLFNYEPHQYNNGTIEPQPGGGVRIKSIYNYPQEGSEPIVKTYTYGMTPGDESGNGVLNSILPIQFKYMESRVESWGVPNGTFLAVPICEFTTQTFSSVATVDNNDYDGTMVYYPFVTEYLGTPGNTTGKITYEYSYSADQLIATMPEFMPGTLTSHWKRGHLVRQREYKQTSPVTFELKRELLNGYEVLKVATYPNVGLLVGERFKREGAVPERVQQGLDGWPSPYVYTYYSLTTGAYKPVTSTETIFEGAQSLQRNTYISYNDYLQPSEIKQVNSKGDTTFQIFRYANQYSTVNAANDAAKGIKKLLESNILSAPIETIKGVKRLGGGGTAFVTAGLINTFFPTKPVLYEEYVMETPTPLGAYNYATIDASGNFNPPAVFKRRLTYSVLDSKNNPTEYYMDDSNLRYSLIWGHNGAHIVAKTEQAKSIEIAYTSFEDNNSASGWQYNEAAVKSLPADAMSGNYVYNFSTISGDIYKLQPPGTYQVSYWAKTACTVNNTAPVSISVANGKGLKLHVHEVSVTAAQPIVVSSANAIIDELRSFPKVATMRTTAYHPSGMIASEINERNDVLNYEFDGLQRLKLVRDDDNRIIRQFAYDFDKGGGLSPNLPISYYNAGRSVTLKRNNCAATDYGTEVTYTVPSKTYMSFISTADADMKRDNDINQNSQTFANTYGECRPKTEVVWQPFALYCQTAEDYGPVPTTSNYSITQIWTEPGTDNVTKFTVSRVSSEWAYGATLRVTIHFAGGGYSDMPVNIAFQSDERDKTITIMLSPDQTSYRNGASISSVQRVANIYQTGYRIYGQRRKKIGGEVVLVEANLPNSGEGPYWPPYRGEIPCELTSTTGPNVFLSAEMTGYFKKSCPAGQDAAGVYFTLPLGAIHSIVSQEDADAQARVIWQANGQQQANAATCR